MLTPLLFVLAASSCDGPGPVGELAADLSVVSMRVADGVAFVKLRADLWPIKIDGVPIHGERYVPVALPDADAIVRGATVRTEGGTDALKIEEANSADDRMDAFRRDLIGGVEPEHARSGNRRAAAVVAWSDEGVSIHVVAPCSEKRVRVDLDVEILSTAADGAWRFFLPRPTRDDARTLDAPLPVDTARMEVLADGAPLDGGRVSVLGDPLIAVDVRPREGPRIRGRAGVAHVTPRAQVIDAPSDAPSEAADDNARDDERASEDVPTVAPIDLLRAELDLPRPLAAPPQGLHLVFVVDTSVSSGAAGLAAGWRLLERILDAAPHDARWAVVAIGRRARVVVPAWRERDDRGVVSLTLENGSDVSGAVRIAQRMADDVDGVGRVVVLSDLAAASDGTPLTGTLKAAPLVHVVQLPEDVDEGGGLSWERALIDEEDTGDGAAIERTGGILVWAGAGEEGEDALAAHLIAPTRIDDPAIALGPDALALGDLAKVVRVGHETADDPTGLPATLHAGQGVRADIVLPGASTRRPIFRGLLWAERLEVPLERTAARDRRALALAAVGALSGDIDDELVRGASVAAGVVSRTTSLAHIPVWRPAAVELMGFGSCGCGCCGCGFGGRDYGYTTRCGGGRAAVDLKERETLSALLQADLELCRVKSATLAVEVADLEILDVDARSEANRCVTERFWTHRLDELAEGSEREPGAFDARRSFEISATLPEDDADG